MYKCTLLFHAVGRIENSQLQSAEPPQPKQLHAVVLAHRRGASTGTNEWIYLHLYLYACVGVGGAIYSAYAMFLCF